MKQYAFPGNSQLVLAWGRNMKKRLFRRGANFPLFGEAILTPGRSLNSAGILQHVALLFWGVAHRAFFRDGCDVVVRE